MKDIDVELKGIFREKEDVRRAREKAMILLSYSDYTVKAMREKLTDLGFEGETVWEVLNFLVDRRYIDEAGYLSRYCEFLAEGKLYGRLKIYAEVLKKGFSKEIINSRFDELTGNFDFVDICLRQIKKSRSYDITDNKSRQKLIASLSRRGFSLSEIKAALELADGRE